jgi:hypothetical protein
MLGYFTSKFSNQMNVNNIINNTIPDVVKENKTTSTYLYIPFPNCFSTLLFRVKFANLPLRLFPDCDQHNHSISLQNKTSKLYFQ